MTASVHVGITQGRRDAVWWWNAARWPAPYAHHDLFRSDSPFVVVSGSPQAGETIEIVLRASDSAGRLVRPLPAGTDPGSPSEATARFWGPGHPAPGTGPPAREVAAHWDETLGGYVALADTDGWEPGSYAARGEVRGMTSYGPARGTSEWSVFTLAPAG